MVTLRSRVELAGITSSISKPYKLAIIARAIPVFPLVASTSLVSGLTWPRSIALLIIFNEALSFTLPPGLLPSSLANTFTAGLMFSFWSSAIGVLPIRSIIPAILFCFNLFLCGF
ncbi:hypothetical protein D3C85_1067420 [compost metagenome]